MISRRCVWVLLILTASGCGSRSGLSWLSLSDNGGSASSPGAAGSEAFGAAGAPYAVAGTSSGGSDHGGMASGGAVHFGGKGGAGVSGAPGAGGAGAGGAGAGGAGAGGAGAPPVVDDPTTFGDDRPGFFVCQNTTLSEVLCRAPDLCCEYKGCVANAGQCNGTALVNCDGKEDCPSSQQCCQGECEDKCTMAPLRHVSCGGAPCVKDLDGDWIPDAVDACLFDEFEDGKGPFPEDGCADYDSDGVIDGIDKCPLGMEDGLPPKPNDGCPQGT